MGETSEVGDVRDFRNFVNAVIDEPAFDNIMRLHRSGQERARRGGDLCGGKGDKSDGYFVQPDHHRGTRIRTSLRWRRRSSGLS